MGVSEALQSLKIYSALAPLFSQSLPDCRKVYHFVETTTFIPLVSIAFSSKVSWISDMLNMKRIFLRDIVNFPRFLQSIIWGCDCCLRLFKSSQIPEPSLTDNWKSLVWCWMYASTLSHSGGRTALVGSGAVVCLVERLWDHSFSEDWRQPWVAGATVHCGPPHWI